ncbi:peroxisomal sarcosine oxidase isoform X2 [Sardina pilchardus]|uniref:peroxisomal sarcosine oxidase isoform X2 n=1 Tax=Sardina pilchardus TaxID=27697 RepID=UPI002E0DB760
MSSQVYDCIVIGAGIQGSCTAYYHAKNNKKTLLLEQFLLPHSRGSSHGQTRIIRKAYEQDFYLRMMEESYKLWAELEKEAGVQLYRCTGLLVMGPEDGQYYSAVKGVLQRNKVPWVMLKREEFSQHIPNFNLVSGENALVDTSAGVLYADKALAALQRLFQSHGGVIKDGSKVTGIKPGPVVTVSTTTGAYQAKSLVITVGPWANTLLSHIGLGLPLKVEKINVCYWREKVPGSYGIHNRFPCFSRQDGPEVDQIIYGLPSNEYPGLMKVCYHVGKDADPDARDTQTDQSDIQILQRFVARCLPGLVPVPAVVESCLYTLTPDNHFVLDRHPTYRNIIVGAGFSAGPSRCLP